MTVKHHLTSNNVLKIGISNKISYLTAKKLEELDIKVHKLFIPTRLDKRHSCEVIRKVPEDRNYDMDEKYLKYLPIDITLKSWAHDGQAVRLTYILRTK